MKKNQIVSALIGAALLCTMGFSCRGARWQTDWSDDHSPATVTLGANEVHDGWYFASGNHVVIDGTINGDAYICGADVQVNGKVDGDLIVAGSRVEINGAVTEHLRAAGGSVLVNGSVGKDVSAAGGSVEIGKAGVIAGNLLAAGGDVDVNGTVGKNAKIASGDFHLAGTVNGDVDFAGGDMQALHAGAIGGALRAFVKNDSSHVTLADSAVRGDVKINIDVRRTIAREHWMARRSWFVFGWFIVLLFTGLVVLLLFPVQFAAVGANILDRPGHSLLWSILIIFGLPIFSVVVMCTVIGIPLALLMLAGYCALLCFSQMALGIALGRRLMGMEGKRGLHLFITFAVGLGIIQLLMLIPFVGAVLVIAGLFFGVGAITMSMHAGWKKLRE